MKIFIELTSEISSVESVSASPDCAATAPISLWQEKDLKTKKRHKNIVWIP